MKTLISNFTKQLEDALHIGQNAALKAPAKTPGNVVISGLGGSGIGGTIASQLTEREAKVPILVNKDYFIPGFIDENSLVIISSYSGNTEETLSAMKEACDRKAEVVCVTSGGEVLDTAVKHHLSHIVIPGGIPPRACLGYSLTQLFYVLHHYGIIGNGFENEIGQAIALLNKEEGSIRGKAESLAEKLRGKIPVIYTAADYEGVGIRWRQQLNENSKMLCWHHVFPEMNHNELVGWKSGDDRLAVLMLRNGSDYERTQKRMDTCREIFLQHTSHAHEVRSKGASNIERSLYLIHFGDWLSYYLAKLNGVDAMEIDVINFLKSELRKVSTS